ncbi:MAG: imidazole glycerol phosphate synthase subunit HisH [Flavobacteriaceae bacterium]|nr:imidazole glycerol phosphate synthase subunit HisH [Flavobacteriaceae bacterium]
MIVIIDYGVGNHGSLVNMFSHINVEAMISSNRNEILMADKIVLPGVGSFDVGMDKLVKADLLDTIEEASLHLEKPTLGICLGMQLMTRSSEEGKLKGLGWINAETKVIPRNPDFKVPHMGWNYLTIEKESELLIGFNNEAKFYFVHSFYVKCHLPGNCVAKTTHCIGMDTVIQNKNLYGVQFHPEKSHKFGMRLLQNFALL